MTTAIGAYATPANVKTRITKADATDDALLGRICDQVNAYIEHKTGRILAPISSVAYTFDGTDAIDSRCLLVPLGVRVISLLEVAPYTGAAFVTTPATDYFARPTAQERDPAWPATEIWMTDIPSSGNAYPYFPAGFANVRVTATWGFPAIPDEIAEIAEIAVVRAYMARRTGQSDIAGTAEDGSLLISRVIDARGWHTLGKYTIKQVSIV